MDASSKRVDWLFGRGLSMGCGLVWAPVKEKLQELTREEQLRAIEDQLLAAMGDQSISTAPIRNFLTLMAEKTNKPWRHRLCTTNWDNLLQKEVDAMVFEELPEWMENSHVFHLNGGIEAAVHPDFRGGILVEWDSESVRKFAPESESVFARAQWNTTFVVVGMSFECAVDRLFLQQLGSVAPHMPIGESRWIVVDPNCEALKKVSERICCCLPGAQVYPVGMGFASWISNGAPELQRLGVISN